MGSRIQEIEALIHDFEEDRPISPSDMRWLLETANYLARLYDPLLETCIDCCVRLNSLQKYLDPDRNSGHKIGIDALKKLRYELIRHGR